MIRVLLAVLALAVTRAEALTVLTVGTSAVFREHGDVASARVHVGADPAFASLVDPTCSGGGTLTLQVAAYPSATARVDAEDVVTLPCAMWKKTARGYLYRDPAGTAGGVRKVVYDHTRFLAVLEGGTYRHITGPVGYAELWIGTGTDRLLARFHDFRRNQADLQVARKPSRAAAAGEAAFWDVLHGVDHTEARQEASLASLTKAVRHDPKDGHAQFLLAMMHLYRFGQATTHFDQATDAAHTDLLAANQAFAKAVPLLWDGTAGDSRVPGFAAAAKFALGVIESDPAGQSAGLADLEAAIDVNAFFNVFDLIPVAQAVPPTDPRYATVLARLDAYLSDPDTLACVVSQPEICSDAGLAPRNSVGALLLFGDLYAKGAALDPANVAKAESWYGIAGLLDRPGYRFESALDARVGHAQDRANLYLDADPSNDPTVIGAGPEACAVCHYE
jgi:hypothetical protein